MPIPYSVLDKSRTNKNCIIIYILLTITNFISVSFYFEGKAKNFY